MGSAYVYVQSHVVCDCEYFWHLDFWFNSYMKV